MHVHILGICGTFMGGIAAIAKAAGHRVTGSDQNVYPPMSTQLEALGIELIQGFDAAQLKPRPDVVVVGNVMTRGVPVIEALLESGIPVYLRSRVAGARSAARRARAGRGGHARQDHHLEHAGVDPRARGSRAGVPHRRRARQFLDQRALRAGTKHFVIEADEYDTAFFDKRAKFVHYRPRTLILNNLEFDHADIYEDLGAIQKQFHHLVRTVPASGRILWNASDANLGGHARDGRVDTVRGIRAPGRQRHHLVARPARGRRLLEVRGARRRPAGGHGALEPVRRAQRGERARGDRRRATRRGAGQPVDRGAGGIQGREAPHGTARRGAAASPCTTTSRITRRPSPRPSTACGARSATSASSRCSSRGRPP